jgi:hypothetical protein
MHFEYISCTIVKYMNYAVQHRLWVSQVEVLKESVSKLSETEPKNVLQHFFLQAAQSELLNESESVKTMSEQMICYALEHSATMTGSCRQKAGSILRHFISDTVIQNVNLSDLRNIAVFEIYKRCDMTLDTYFERYSSPPGSAAQNTVYNHMAHGRAMATADTTITLGHILLYMQILKRFFVVSDHVFHNSEICESTLNWMGAMWASHIQQKTLGDLVWELFLDIYAYETL